MRKEPIFQNNLLVYNGMYYQIGEEHKEFCAEKTQDDDYYVLTLAAIAKELEGKRNEQGKGTPCCWTSINLGGYSERGFSKISASE